MAGCSKDVNKGDLASSEQELTLEKCFATIVAQKETLNLKMNNVQNILHNELNVELTALSEGLRNVLAESLIYFFKVWPGWSRVNDYNAGNITFQQWYKKFKQFLIFKVNYVISNKDKYLEEIEKEKTESSTDVCSVKVQTLSSVAKPDAPYELVVSGSPHLLNSIVFVEVNGDMHIKQHAEMPWEDLNVKTILNWPYVSVEIRLPDIHFIRTACPDYKRYSSYDTEFNYSDDSHKPLVRLLSTRNPQHEVYKSNFFAAYFDEFLKTAKGIEEIQPQRLAELQDIFEEFTRDINEVNLEDGTMSTNVSVRYNIGSFTYLRNKKMAQNESSKKNLAQSINFYEILKPMVCFELFSFTPVQDLKTDNISFLSLNKLKNSKPQHKTIFKNMVNTYCINYKCTFCKCKFNGCYALKMLQKHFNDYHKSEQAVVCMKCRKQFQFKDLVMQRWSHKCTQKNATETKN